MARRKRQSSARRPKRPEGKCVLAVQARVHVSGFCVHKSLLIVLKPTAHYVPFLCGAWYERITVRGRSRVRNYYRLKLAAKTRVKVYALTCTEGGGEIKVKIHPSDRVNYIKNGIFNI